MKENRITTICRTSAGLIVQLEQTENVHIGDYYKDSFNGICFRVEAMTASRNDDGRVFYRIVEVDDAASGLQDVVAEVGTVEGVSEVTNLQGEGVTTEGEPENLFARWFTKK